MAYRSVLFTVPVEEQTEDDTQEFVRRELAFEGLLGVLRAASRPEASPTADRETAPDCSARA